MARKHEVGKINLDAYEFEPFVNEKYTGVTIRWDSDIGLRKYLNIKEGDALEVFKHDKYIIFTKYQNEEVAK